MNSLLQINNLSVKHKDLTILDNINLNIAAGEVVGIIGESGSGKSTLLKAIINLLPPQLSITQGQILLNNSDNLLAMNSRSLRNIRGATIGTVFQNCAASLCPTRSIGIQLHESLSAHMDINIASSRTQALEIFNTLNLPNPERIWDSYPFELSGGMNQRVGIAAALLLQPKLILADEPTSDLDVVSQAQVIAILKQKQREQHTAIIFVTHNIALLNNFADHIFVMYQGRIIESGTSNAIINQPHTKYTQMLIQSVPKITRRI